MDKPAHSLVEDELLYYMASCSPQWKNVYRLLLSLTSKIFYMKENIKASASSSKATPSLGAGHCLEEYSRNLFGLPCASCFDHFGWAFHEGTKHKNTTPESITGNRKVHLDLSRLCPPLRPEGGI